MGLSEHKRTTSGLSVTTTVVTCSDTRTEENDDSGRLIRDRLSEHGHEIIFYRLISDTPGELESTVMEAVSRNVDAILITGGTGLSGRDNAYKVLLNMYDSFIPGFGELFRMLSFEEIGSASLLSRSSAGVVGTTVIFSMPGSTPAVRLAMDRLILPELAHIVAQRRS